MKSGKHCSLEIIGLFTVYCFLISGNTLFASIEPPAPVEFSVNELENLYPHLVLSPIPVLEYCPNSAEESDMDYGDIMKAESYLANKARSAGLLDKAQVRESVEELTDRSKTLFLKYSMEREADITDDQITAYYEENLEEFESPEVMWAEYFFVEVPEISEEAKTRDLLEDVLNESREITNLEKLKKSAARKGVQTSKQPISFFRGKYSPKIEEAVYSSGVRAFTEIIRTDHGWHLFFVTKHDKAVRTSLEEAHDRILKKLRGKHIEEKREELLGFLRELYPLEIDESSSTAAVAGRMIELDSSKETSSTGLDQQADNYRVIAWLNKQYEEDTPSLMSLRELLVNNALVEAFLRSLQDQVSVSEEEIKSEYSRNQKFYLNPPEKHVWEFSVPLSEGTTDQSSREIFYAKRELKNALIDLRLAVANSDNPLKTLAAMKLLNSDLVADRGMNKMGPRGRVLDMATQSLEINEVSEVVESNSRYHFFLVTDIKPSEPMTFEEAYERIESAIRSWRWEELVKQEICDALENS